MDNLDDLDNNVKISDSVYSASCSHSQSRSRSSKSTHSSRNSSGSSGYGGQPSTSCNSNSPTAKRSKDKDSKKEKPIYTDISEGNTENKIVAESPVVTEQPKKEQTEVNNTAAQKLAPADEDPETTEIVETDAKQKDVTCYLPLENSSVKSNGFSCVISMNNGVVMYTTSSLTATLGFPKGMWNGRSFIDFVHASDRHTFASQITKGLALPTTVNGTPEIVQPRGGTISTMVCRIRSYRGLTSGFGVKEREVTFMPFLLKLTFKNVKEETGEMIYLVVQATALSSAFKEPNEIVKNAVPFVIRHAANGSLEYIDPEAVPYLGYLPQDIIGQNVLQLYHKEDLPYLTQVYETIVETGGLTKSKPYRMITQNRDCIKLETEWSSFVNPWSKKLEFVIAKHNILEGPANPDVFQAPDTRRLPKFTQEEKKKFQALCYNIIEIMNKKVLTQPAKLAKQQMSKRCQDVTSLMESFIEEQPKPDGALRVDVNLQDHKYFAVMERDTMIGSLSPHHDCSVIKSKTESPLSYNQINYDETLQRYFENHQPLQFVEYNNAKEEHKLGMKNTKRRYSSPNCLSPLAQRFGDSSDLTSSCESDPAASSTSRVNPFGNKPLRLTESLLSKHNAEMEKEMLRSYRETHSSSKGDREKITTENRQKKNEHLARCNAMFQPTNEQKVKNKLHGVKRHSKFSDLDKVPHKHHCPPSRQPHRHHTTSTAEMQPSTSTAAPMPVRAKGTGHGGPQTPLPKIEAAASAPLYEHCGSAAFCYHHFTTSMASAHWQNNPVKGTNAFLLGVGLPPQMTMVDTATPQPMIAMTTIPMPCMMYGQTMYGSPIMYSGIAPQVTYPMQQTQMPHTMRYNNLLYSQQEVNNPQLKPQVFKESDQAQSNESRPAPKPNCYNKTREVGISSKEESADRTDGESSYSSFYSSFFKTESGSAEESDPIKCNETNNAAAGIPRKSTPFDSSSTSFTYSSNSDNAKKSFPKRKLEPTWMDQVQVSSELIYKYQIMTKPMEEVLSNDKEKIKALTQPALVNEQLGQLYLDLHLEGVAARLTLEEGITSSSSSGEDTTTVIKKVPRKRKHSKLVTIYEEDAPLPPPNDYE